MRRLTALSQRSTRTIVDKVFEVDVDKMNNSSPPEWVPETIEHIICCAIASPAVSKTESMYRQHRCADEEASHEANFRLIS